MSDWRERLLAECALDVLQDRGRPDHPCCGGEILPAHVLSQGASIDDVELWRGAETVGVVTETTWTVRATCPECGAVGTVEATEETPC